MSWNYIFGVQKGTSGRYLPSLSLTTSLCLSLTQELVSAFASLFTSLSLSLDPNVVTHFGTQKKLSGFSVSFFQMIISFNNQKSFLLCVSHPPHAHTTLLHPGTRRPPPPSEGCTQRLCILSGIYGIVDKDILSNTCWGRNEIVNFKTFIAVYFRHKIVLCSQVTRKRDTGSVRFNVAIIAVDFKFKFEQRNTPSHDSFSGTGKKTSKKEKRKKKKISDIPFHMLLVHVKNNFANNSKDISFPSHSCHGSIWWQTCEQRSVFCPGNPTGISQSFTQRNRYLTCPGMDIEIPRGSSNLRSCEFIRGKKFFLAQETHMYACQTTPKAVFGEMFWIILESSTLRWHLFLCTSLLVFVGFR